MDNTSKRTLWGRLLSGVVIAFITWDAVIKLLMIVPVIESFQRLGFSSTSSVTVGLVELACLIVYVVPRTAAFGALLLTGFLGGAVAIHARVGDPLASHILFPVYVAVLAWGGLLLREPRLWALVATRDPREK